MDSEKNETSELILVPIKYIFLQTDSGSSWVKLYAETADLEEAELVKQMINNGEEARQIVNKLAKITWESRWARYGNNSRKGWSNSAMLC